MVEEAAGSQSDHEEHHDQDGVEFKMESERIQEDVLVGKMMTCLETGTALQTQQDNLSQGIKYCLGMDNINLVGFVEQIHQPQTCEKVCALCMDGPR